VTPSIANLVKVLAEKLDALELMHSVLKEEQKHIIGLNADEVDRLSTRKEEITELIRELNEKCRISMVSALREAGLPENSSLTLLISKMAGAEKERLRSLQALLIKSARGVNDSLATNSGLLENTLKFIDRSMAFFAGLFSKTNTYGAAGQMLEASPVATLVCREI
jgi:hypothetical protein